MARRFATSIILAAGLSLSSCGGSGDGQFDVAFMDTQENLFAEGVRISAGGQHVRAATRSGLVALDQQGEVIPALADRWNVIEGGSIFVFRLREGNWPDGSELTAESVRLALRRSMRDLRGTSLGLDLTPIDEIRAMAGRVVEIRLSSAMPDLLRLLAQPELGLLNGEGETGPMSLERNEGGALLKLKPPEERGLPMTEDWQEHVRPIQIHALDYTSALERFEEGELEVVLGGSIGEFPLADTGPLSRGTVRVDPAYGLFGLQVLKEEGVLASPELREAISMAVDRQALMAPFNLGGWVATTRVVAPGMQGDPGLVGERWQDQSLEDLRSVARTRIAAWRGERLADEEDVSITLGVEMGETPGLAILFDELAGQMAAIGIQLVRVDEGSGGDLALVDTLARYAAPLWFLNQFNCLLDRGLCSEEADVLAGQALDENDAVVRARLLADAEVALTRSNVYIPIGFPLRWSLVRGNVDGFSGNRWGFHPLPDMAVIPR